MVGLLILLLGVLLILAYRRYSPVWGVPCQERVHEDSFVLDIRDYRAKISEKEVSLQIPYAYLIRHYREIPEEPLHVIASDQVELNLGVRFLKGKNYKVKSFEIVDCPCRRGGVFHGV